MPNVKSSHAKRTLLIKAVWNNPVCVFCMERVEKACTHLGADDTENFFYAPYQEGHIKCTHAGSPHYGKAVINSYYSSEHFKCQSKTILNNSNI